jgi:hypothetical protein
MSSYSEGFKLGYSANAPIAGISEGIQKFTQEYRKQEEIGRQRQEAYDSARSEFKKKQEETYGKYSKEDLYDNTGITDFDTLGDKFTKSARETYEINEFAFRNGFIDESELTARNNTLKAQSQKLTKVFDQANKMLEEKDKLETQGLGNKLNDIRLDLLEDFSKNVKVSAGLDGLYMSTIGKDGQQKNISASEFSKILEADSGVDMQKDLDDLLKLGGYREYTTKDGKRKVRSYDRNDELGTSLIKTKVEAYTDQQVIDAMFELGLATDNPEEAKEDVKLIGSKNIFDFEVSDETRGQLTTAMQDKLSEQQRFKMISTEAKPEDKPVDKSLVSTSRITNADASDGKGDRIRFSPNKLQGLQMSYIQKYKGFQESIEEQIAKDNLVGYEVDARKDATFLGANYFPDTGVFEIEIGYDVMKMDKEGKPELDDTGESIKQPVRSSFTINELPEINDFYSGIGRKDLIISSKDWEASRKRREKEKGNQGTGSKYNNK